jgi:hypothetical protein
MQVQIKFFVYLSAVRAAYIFDIPAGIQDGKKVKFLQKMINLSDKGTVLSRFTTHKEMLDRQDILYCRSDIPAVFNLLHLIEIWV